MKIFRGGERKCIEKKWQDGKDLTRIGVIPGKSPLAMRVKNGKASGKNELNFGKD